ncbi:hypothetical protein BKA62DRAFT_687340 [Auriculariales sp. MPI-PUGE-AT-0066]|nr:hypothetical protein BKA62DRAFT_687340 [Auriculariales sp. MPI-PUGE-AT-0066]
MTTATNTIYLRPSLDFDPSQASNRNNLVAYSPDILPLYKTEIQDPDQLISSYGTFIAQSIVPEEQNLLYVRGAAKNAAAKASASIVIGSVTNELILWPQVLNAATNLGTTSLTYTPPKTKSSEPGVTASIDSLEFTPPGRGGRHDAFVAVSDGSFGKLKTAANYDDLLKTVGSPAGLSLLNAVIADPVFDVYSLSTRLRFFDDSDGPINLELDIEAIGIPTGFSVSIFSDNPAIVMAKTPVDTSTRIGFTVPVKDGLDTSITVQLYKGDGMTVPPDSSSISLVASVNKGSGHIVDTVILGAEHVVFDSAIRLARSIVKGELLGGSVQGFYFRDNINDTNVFPREGTASCSPDIQLLGHDPVQNIGQVLGPDQYKTDVASADGLGLEPGANNYIYLRGATTSATHIELSLYAIPNNLLITPDMYSANGITEMDINNNPVLAVRELNAPAAGTYTIDTPFNMANPKPVKTIDSNSDHYCLIAEWRQWASDPINKPYWPHQDVEIKTGSDFVNWILSNPAVAWRNMSWTSNPNAPTEMWQVNCAVPAAWGATDKGALAILCTNMPVGGTMQFESTATAGGTVLSIKQVAITNPNQTIGVQFTGLQGPWNTTVTVQWWQGSGPPRQFGSQLQMQIQRLVGSARFVLSFCLLLAITHDSACSALATQYRKRGKSIAQPDQANWPLVVGPDYPHLERRSPLGHSVGRKRPLLLGGAHALPLLPNSGTFDQSKTRVWVAPVDAVGLGGDGKGVGKDKLAAQPPAAQAPAPAADTPTTPGHHHHHHHNSQAHY